tara:strand:+ start:396 stop:926 length:531 start_codon:yes stop_codon:yes gene_type:complete
MKLGKYKILILFYTFFFIKTSLATAEDKIESIPLINLEDLSPTFEEDKSELEKQEDKNLNMSINSETNDSFKSENGKKIYINLTALDKITAKTSSIRLAVGEVKSFGSLEIKALKCAYSKDIDNPDTLAYIQVKDLSSKDNNQVFLFNGWTFASNPTLQSIDHPVYDLWITNCENI